MDIDGQRGFRGSHGVLDRDKDNSNQNIIRLPNNCTNSVIGFMTNDLSIGVLLVSRKFVFAYCLRIGNKLT